MRLPAHLVAHKRRSLYDAMVERVNARPNDLDGSTASRAIPPVHTKSLLEEQNIAEDKDVADLFCKIMDDYRNFPDPDLLPLEFDAAYVDELKKHLPDISGSPVSADQLGVILDLVKEGTISGKIAKDLFEIVWSEGGDPRQLVEQRGMKQVTNNGGVYIGDSGYGQYNQDLKAVGKRGVAGEAVRARIRARMKASPRFNSMEM